VSSQYGRRDETCPVSTEGWTRRVHFVREGGEGRGDLLERRENARALHLERLAERHHVFPGLARLRRPRARQSARQALGAAFLFGRSEIFGRSAHLHAGSLEEVPLVRGEVRRGLREQG
jgi:hypothetical protein